MSDNKACPADGSVLERKVYRDEATDGSPLPDVVWVCPSCGDVYDETDFV